MVQFATLPRLIQDNDKMTILNPFNVILTDQSIRHTTDSWYQMNNEANVYQHCKLKCDTGSQISQSYSAKNSVVSLRPVLGLGGGRSGGEDWGVIGQKLDSGPLHKNPSVWTRPASARPHPTPAPVSPLYTDMGPPRPPATSKHEYCRRQELELEDLKYEYTSFEAVQSLHWPSYGGQSMNRTSGIKFPHKEIM